jgi:hypothetical protein
MDRFYQHPFVLLEIGTALLGLTFVLIGCVMLALAHRRREKLAWAVGTRLAAGVGGTAFSVVVLMAPAALSWIAHHIACSRVEEALARGGAWPEVSTVAQGFQEAVVTSTFADAAQAILLLPCAALIGLSLTVPFFLTRAPGGVR